MGPMRIVIPRDGSSPLTAQGHQEAGVCDHRGLAFFSCPGWPQCFDLRLDTHPASEWKASLPGHRLP